MPPPSSSSALAGVGLWRQHPQQSPPVTSSSRTPRLPRPGQRQHRPGCPGRPPPGAWNTSPGEGCFFLSYLSQRLPDEWKGRDDFSEPVRSTRPDKGTCASSAALESLPGGLDGPVVPHWQRCHNHLMAVQADSLAGNPPSHISSHVAVALALAP